MKFSLSALLLLILMNVSACAPAITWDNTQAVFMRACTTEIKDDKALRGKQDPYCQCVFEGLKETYDSPQVLAEDEKLMTKALDRFGESCRQAVLN